MFNVPADISWELATYCFWVRVERLLLFMLSLLLLLIPLSWPTQARTVEWEPHRWLFVVERSSLLACKCLLGSPVDKKFNFPDGPDGQARGRALVLAPASGTGGARGYTRSTAWLPNPVAEFEGNLSLEKKNPGCCILGSSTNYNIFIRSSIKPFVDWRLGNWLLDAGHESATKEKNSTVRLKESEIKHDHLCSW
jgi:hypothetical protein